MKKIPETENALVIRTDFSDNDKWEIICKTIENHDGEFQTYVAQYNNCNIGFLAII